MSKETAKDKDYRLMRAVQNGDMVAFNEIVERYKNRLLNVLTRMLSSTEEAEDVVQVGAAGWLGHRPRHDRPRSRRRY